MLQQEDDLAAQVQSLLDEASAEEAASFVSPEELLGQEEAEPTDPAQDAINQLKLAIAEET